MRRYFSFIQRRVTAVVVVLASMGLSASAAEITSAYTKINLEDCNQLERAAEEGTFGGSWTCPGYGGLQVLVSEGDLRMFVSFGPDAENEPAAGQTLSRFNTINETLEWRLRDGVPFATILRWFPSLDEGKGTGSVLIVTQLKPGATCQIGRIDAQANPGANQMSRDLADTMAGTYDCSLPPMVPGNKGIFQ